MACGRHQATGADTKWPTFAGVGDTASDTPARPAGAVYLYRIDDGKATQLAEFAGFDMGPGGNFGLSVSLTSGILLVGRPGQHPQPDNDPFTPKARPITTASTVETQVR